eukprot:1754163-Heterocapsa_arctica.AAC.1
MASTANLRARHVEGQENSLVIAGIDLAESQAKLGTANNDIAFANARIGNMLNESDIAKTQTMSVIATQ